MGFNCHILLHQMGGIHPNKKINKRGHDEIP
jgi:hypothetical protein